MCGVVPDIWSDSRPLSATLLPKNGGLMHPYCTLTTERSSLDRAGGFACNGSHPNRRLGKCLGFEDNDDAAIGDSAWFALE